MLPARTTPGCWMSTPPKSGWCVTFANSAMISGVSFCQTMWADWIHSRAAEPSKRIDQVAIYRAADLEPVRDVGLDEHVDQPGAVVVDVAGIAAAADDLSAPVAEADVVIQIQSAGRRLRLPPACR